MPCEVIPAVTDAGLPKSSLPALFQATAVKAAASALDSVPGMTTAIKVALHAAQKRAYAESFKTVYLSSLAFGGVALIISNLSADVDKYLTGFVNKTVVQAKEKENQVGLQKV